MKRQTAHRLWCSSFSRFEWASKIIASDQMSGGEAVQHVTANANSSLGAEAAALALMSGDKAVVHVMANVNRGLSAEAAALALVKRWVELRLASKHEEADNTSAVVLLSISV
eukprot:gene8229-1495_t